MIPLFDSLTHPTISGTLNGLLSTFDSTYSGMKETGFKWACAVGLEGVEKYDHNLYIKECRKYKCFIPIAGLNPKQKVDDLEKEIITLSKLGFKGIKIHPRNSNIGLDFDTLPDILRFANESNLVVFLCTYSHANLERYPESDPLYSLVKLLKSSKDTKVLLLHGGDVNLLRYAELVKRSPNVVLDLSFTIMKYQGSSLDLDIKYLFKNLDRRICLGTDHPEFSHKILRERFEDLTQDLLIEKKENIGYKNLINFFNIAD
jgi:predicted TIM-barrel fold metal-dependent hydrolase